MRACCIFFPGPSKLHWVVDFGCIMMDECASFARTKKSHHGQHFSRFVLGSKDQTVHKKKRKNQSAKNRNYCTDTRYHFHVVDEGVPMLPGEGAATAERRQIYLLAGVEVGEGLGEHLDRVVHQRGLGLTKKGRRFFLYVHGRDA